MKDPRSRYQVRLPAELTHTGAVFVLGTELLLVMLSAAGAALSAAVSMRHWWLLVGLVGAAAAEADRLIFGSRQLKGKPRVKGKPGLKGGRLYSGGEFGTVALLVGTVTTNFGS